MLGLKDGSYFKKWYDLFNVICVIIIEMEMENKERFVVKGNNFIFNGC